jgi:ribosomal protein S18 acetylase RimI-like enzyme
VPEVPPLPHPAVAVATATSATRQSWRRTLDLIRAASLSAAAGVLHYYCLIELRPARLHEADTLLAIQREAAVGAYAHIYPPERYPFPDDAVREVWAEALSDQEVEVYVAEVEGVPAGAVSVGKGFLSTLYVLPAYQGSGVGSALHDLALERLRAHGFQEARLWTLEGNDAGRRFYERRGWLLTDETRVVPYPPHPIDVQYALPLEPA